MTLDTSDFWTPEFQIDRRDDGTILMRQKDALPEHFPTLADYLDKVSAISEIPVC